MHDELFAKTQRCSYQTLGMILLRALKSQAADAAALRIVRVRTAEMCLSLLNNARWNRTSGRAAGRRLGGGRLKPTSTSLRAVRFCENLVSQTRD